MKENRTKGLSMIELIIVVGIIGLLTGFITIGFGYIQSGNIRSAAKDITSNLSKLKYDAMSNEEMPVMYIYNIGGQYYMYCASKEVANASELTKDKGSVLCNSNCKITYEGGKPISEGAHIKIAYKKSGGLSSVSSLTKDISDITVSKKEGKGTSYVITIYKETGKCTMSN